MSSFMDERRKHWATTEKQAKVAAQRAVQYCVRRGWLTAPTVCPRCGSRYMIEAHHPDYNKPLEVEWMCRGCHKREHREPSE